MTTLTWDAPLDNCDGSPLTDLDHYELPVFRAIIIGWAMDLDGNLYPIYVKSLTHMVAARDSPTLSLADPGLGEVLGWEWPEAIDTSGNSSASCEAAP